MSEISKARKHLEKRVGKGGRQAYPCSSVLIRVIGGIRKGEILFLCKNF